MPPFWTSITYGNSKLKSESMYTTPEVKSGLLTGTQWDTLIVWIDYAGKSIWDSRTWGNYGNSLPLADVSGFGSLQATGYSENWKANNIYDLAGNAWEWTNEIYGTQRTSRGGSFEDDGSYFAASSGFFASTTATGTHAGFRVVLYIL